MGELHQFRREVRGFLAKELTPEIIEVGRKTTSIFAPFDGVMKWQRILYEKGWVAPAWPEKYGGTGWSEDQQAIFHEECVAAGAPRMLPHGLAMLGPLIFNKGTAEQKQKYLPGILSGDDFWAQGYSEPGAGSDLASLRCRAISDGDDYLVTGSKIWTTYAHHANKMFMLVRTSTDGKPQAGITFLLLDDIHAEGITIRPIVGLDGLTEQCEVFFDGVQDLRRNAQREHCV